MTTLHLQRDSFEKEFVTTFAPEGGIRSREEMDETQKIYPNTFHEKYDHIDVTQIDYVGPHTARVAVTIVTTYKKVKYDDLYYKLKVLSITTSAVQQIFD